MASAGRRTTATANGNQPGGAEDVHKNAFRIAGFFLREWIVNDTWASIISGAVLALASGFAVWMFRIDRAVVRIAHIAEGLIELRDTLHESVKDIRTEKEREHQALWTRIDQQGDRLTDHGERITRLESRNTEQGPTR